MAGYALDDAVRDGRLRYVPIRLSSVPNLVHRIRPDVAVVAGIRRGSDLAFLGTVGWGPAAAEVAHAVVVEVDEDAPDLGTPVIPGEIAAVVKRATVSTPPVPRVPDALDLEIGRRVAELVPDDATIQLGPGGIAEAIVASLERPVEIWSGLLTDAMAALADRDLLRGTVTAGYIWGGQPIVELHRTGRLRLAPVEVTHDIARVSAIPRFVACNTALEVGLDGAVNVERVDGRIVAGIGGHADFSRPRTAPTAGSPSSPSDRRTDGVDRRSCRRSPSCRHREATSGSSSRSTAPQTSATPTTRSAPSDSSQLPHPSTVERSAPLSGERW